MLNLLVDKAIERSLHKLDPMEPIFTISYGSQTPKTHRQHQFKSKSKTVVNKILKTNRKQENTNIFQKWKSKTIQKLKDMEKDINRTDSNRTSQYIPSKKQKISEVGKKLMAGHMELSISSSPIIPMETVIPDKRSFIVHKKKLTSKTLSIRANNSPSKSIYLMYQDEKRKQIQSRGTVGSVSEGTNRLVYQRKKGQQMKINLLKEVQEQNLRESNGLSQQNSRMKSKQSSKNVSFFSTIQYKTVPKEEIRHYKAEEFQSSKRNILNRTQQDCNYLVKPQTNNPNREARMNQTISSSFNTLNVPEIESKMGESSNSHNPESSSVHARISLTQKRHRHRIIPHDQFIKQHFTTTTKGFLNSDSYRPWSPVKTNPVPFLINDEQLLWEQSKSFNLFQRLQQINNILE